MIFSTITQDGLKLTTDVNQIPAQLSNNIQIKFIQDSTNYSGWIPTVQAGLLDSEIVECADTIQTSALVIEDGIITVSNNIMSRSGYLVLSITLTNGDENVVLPPVAYKVDASVGAISILPDNTEAWQQVIEAYTSALFSAYSEENVAPVLEQAQQAVQTANTASSNANQALTNANQAISTANQASEDAQEAIQNAESATTAANNAASAANTAAGTANSAAQDATDSAGLANTAASQAQSAATQATQAAESVNTVLSGTDVPDASTGKNGDLYVVVGSGANTGNVYKKNNSTWELQMSIVGPSKITLNGATQPTFEAKGLGYYISDDDESVTIGTYEEWVSAGSPAFPSE